MVTIYESSMLFGEFEDDKVFQIETSSIYNIMGKGIKVVEFILLKDDNELNFVEAKSSSPKPETDNGEKLNEYVEKISDKFIDSFNLYYSIILKRNAGYEEVSNRFFELSNEKIVFKFILVIKNHQKEWLAPISDALKRSLVSHIKIWNSNIIVINEDIAKRYGLVKASI